MKLGARFRRWFVPGWFVPGALALAVAPSTAYAYCYATSCPDGSVACSGGADTGCGVPLRWARDCVGVTLQERASAAIPIGPAREAVRAAFGAWAAADCGGGDGPGIGLIDMGDVVCDQVEYSSSDGNANIVVFREDVWPYPESPLHLGLTTVVYDTETGEIYDADIEVNATYELTVTDPVGFDLQSILTHEAGHFLGLAHSPDAEATMAAQYYEGTTTFRSLAADDVAAVCAAYPPKAIDVETCNPIPRHGFSELCAADQAYASCALGSPPSDRGALAACAAALGCLAARAKRGNLRRR